MNILRVVDSASTLFAKKVHVSLIHAESKELIATHILDSSLLPDKFNKPTILEFDNTHWRVVKVENQRSRSYFRAPKLSLQVISTHSVIPNKYTIPTQASLDQILTSAATLFNDFTLSLIQDDWLQLEFLTLENLELVQETTLAIETIINSPDENENLLGYSSIHTRELSYDRPLAIPLEEFCTSLNIGKKGNVQLPDGSFIEGGFAIQSDNYTYYGVADNGTIQQLAIKKFDCVDDELSDILSKYNLLFVDWCNANILS